VAEPQEVGFYRCTRQPAVEVAVALAARAWETRQRLLLVAAPAQLDTLDERLWTDRPDQFLAHGRAGAPDEELQPILLADAVHPPANGALLLMLVDVPLPDAIEGFRRTFLLFEEGSETHAAAREAWKGLAGRTDVARVYWQQKGGRWEKAG
jgi:DNA polymerase-3 subunit chi